MITEWLEMGDGETFETSTADWDQEAGTQHVAVSYDESERTFFPGYVDEIIFAASIEQYFAARGVAQKKLRDELCSELTQTKGIEEKLAMVLAKVESSKSQDTIAAAIDLLTPFAAHLGPVALLSAFEDLVDEDVAFVLTSAMCRQYRRLTSLFLTSRHSVVREAAIEVLANYSVLETKLILENIASSDPSPALRERARQLMEQ